MIPANGDEAKRRAESYVEKLDELSIWTDGSRITTNQTVQV